MLPDYEVPTGVKFVTEVPVTGANKVDFRALEGIANKQ